MGKVTILEKQPRIIRWLHWINVPLLGLMIWSGLLIYWADQAYVKIPRSIVENLSMSFRLAEGMGWHFLIMWPFSINGLIYAIYLIRRRHFNPSYTKKQRHFYTYILIAGILSVLSGMAIYKPVQLGWLTAVFGGYRNARLVHFLMMIIFLIFICVHLVQVMRHGWNNFRSMIAGYEIEKE